MKHKDSLQEKKRALEAIESIYNTFKSPPPLTIEGCPCCIATRGTDLLLTTPLRQITGEALYSYVTGALTTVGNQKDFLYLLPRIFEVSVLEPENANDPEIVLGKLARAGWKSWASDKQHIIETFIDAWFELALANDLADADGWIGDEAERVMCGAARAGLPLGRWLLRLCEPDAARVLADMQKRFPNELSGFWEFAPAEFQAFLAILTRGQA